MVANRSVPANIILPHIIYRDLPEALAWLNYAFGFVEHYRYGDPAGGAQIHLGPAYVMVRSAEGKKTPAELGYGTQTLTVFVEDVDAYYARAKAAGAKMVEELHETMYGERQYGVEDLDGMTGCSRGMRMT